VNDYFLWEIVQRAKSEGFKKLDLGEPDARISSNKAKFDPVLEPFCFVERTNTKGKPVYSAYQKLSWAKKLVSGALPRAHR